MRESRMGGDDEIDVHTEVEQIRALKDDGASVYFAERAEEERADRW